MINGWIETNIGIEFDLFAGGDVDRECFSHTKTNQCKYPIYANALQKAGLYGYTANPKYRADSITITGRGDIGVAMYRDTDFDAIVRLLVLTPKLNSNADSRFTTYLINSQIIFPIESTGVPQLTVPQIRSVELTLPPLPEQRHIAAVLSDTDELITTLEKLIAKKRVIKQGTMQELLTGKRRLPRFSGEWVNINLVANSTLKARIGWQGLTTVEYLDSGYSYLITGTDFINGKIAWETCHYVDKYRYDQDTNIQVANGDILITKDGTIGKVAIVSGLNKRATLNSGVFVLRPKTSTYDHKFVYYILLSQIFINFLDKLAAGSTINHLYQKDFVNFEFIVPPTIAEQTAIVSILSDMDAEIDTLTAKLNKLRNIKQGMMSELLTGRIRLLKEDTDNGEN